MTFLADTNILGELSRPRPNRGVLTWAEHVQIVGVSVVTVEEVRFGLAWKPHARVDEWLERFLAEHCQVLPITKAIADRAGTLRGRLRGLGHTRTQADMLIAATAATSGLTLVTRNAHDFADCGITVLNPFETRRCGGGRI